MAEWSVVKQLRRMAARVLRPARIGLARFVQPPFDERFGYLQATMDRVAARLESDRAALEQRLLERIEAALHASNADIAAAVDKVEALAGSIGRLEDASRAQQDAIESRIESVRSEADASSRAQQDAIESRIESVRAASDASIARAVGDLTSRSASELSALRRTLFLEIERTRSRLAVPDSFILELERFRTTPEYAEIFAKPDPLVSVIVPTYNRAELLVERCLRSILDQDYVNLEILVVGDGGTDDTESRVRAIGDERITYVEFSDPLVPRTLSFGTEASNAMMVAATGDLITHLDDDDEYTPDRIGKLVRFLQETRSEFVWHPFWWQEVPGAEWAVNEAESLEFAKVTTGSVLYIGWLKRLLWDPLSFRYRLPADWLLFHMMRDVGVRMVRHPEPLLRHYKEGRNPRWQEDPESSDPHYPPDSRASHSLVPPVGSEAEYESLLGQLAPWVAAVEEVGRRVGISVDGRLRAAAGDHPSIAIASSHFVKLYGPWWDGHLSFDTELQAYQLMSRVTDLETPRLVAFGGLTEDWRYIVTTLVPGDQLADVRASMDGAALQEVMGWIGGFVRRLNAVPISDQERDGRGDAFRTELAWRHANLPGVLAERGTLPTHLLAEVEGWLPPMDELMPASEPTVLVHGDLHGGHVLGSWSDGRFEPTGIIDFNRTHIAHPYRELGPLNRWVTQGDASLLHSFLAEAGWDGTDRPDFPRRALAYALLNPADQLVGLPALDEARILDDLAGRLFARPAA